MVSPMDSSDSRHLAQNLSLSAAENSSFVRPKGNYGRRISFSSRGGGGFEMKCAGEMEPRSPESTPTPAWLDAEKRLATNF